jgi:hypothetical protein
MDRSGGKGVGIGVGGTAVSSGFGVVEGTTSTGWSVDTTALGGKVETGSDDTGTSANGLQPANNKISNAKKIKIRRLNMATATKIQLPITKTTELATMITLNYTPLYNQYPHPLIKM